MENKRDLQDVLMLMMIKGLKGDFLNINPNDFLSDNLTEEEIKDLNNDNND